MKLPGHSTRGVLSLVALLMLAALLSACCCMGGLDDEDIDINLPEGNPVPPVAVISAVPDQGVEPLEVQLDASASYDTDGTIEQYDWDFDGDGTYDLIDGGATPTFTYTSTLSSSVSFVETAQFAPTVRVTDNDGLTDDASTTVTIGELVPPVAAGTAVQEGVGLTTALFDGSASSDADGTVEQYDWDFDNDGTYDLLDGGATPPAHDYGGFGPFTATLRVTDNDGLQDTAEIPVTLVAPANEPPVAALVPTPATGNAPLDVTWDASGSTDSDGTIVQYDWDMDNDGTFELLDGGPNQAANYPAGGDYTVGVQVTDDDGATDQTTATVNVNNPPVAALVPIPDAGPVPLDVTWDASGSTDSDGTIVQYDWDMDNDGTFEITDGGSSQPASYPDFGAYTVGVRVTDDDGATDETTATVNANTPPVADLVPTPDSGPLPLDVTWDASGSTDADGTIVQYDWDMDNDGTFEITDGGASQAANYPAFGDYTVGVRVTDDDGLTDETTATVSVLSPPVADLQATPNSGTVPLEVTWDASGSTDADGTIVQFDWDMDNDGTFEVIDGTDSQTLTYLSGGLITVGVRVTDDDGLTDETTQTIDLNNPPTALLVGSGELAPDQETFIVTFDATGSTDSDGIIVQYDWDMENDGIFEIIDGGAVQSFNVFEYGSWTATVRVTDDDGATDTDTATVERLSPPIAILIPTPSFGWVPLDVTLDASSSFDPDGGPIMQYDYDLDDDGIYELIDQPSVIVHQFDVEGDYTVWVRVTDDEGETAEGPAFISAMEPPA